MVNIKFDKCAVDNPKLSIINHENYISKQFLPCFNSTAIERFFHKIQDLSDQFAYLNDDFLLQKISLRNVFLKMIYHAVSQLFALITNCHNGINIDAFESILPEKSSFEK